MKLKYILLYLLLIGIIEVIHSQSLNRDYMYNDNHRFIGGGQVCIYNKIPYVFYCVLDTTDTTILAAASVSAKLNNSGLLQINPFFRPDSLAWFIAPNYYCKTHSVSDGFISSGLGNSYTNRNKALLVVYDTNGIVKFYSAIDHYGAGSFDAIRTKKNQYMLAGRVIEFSEGLPMFILTDSLGTEISYKFYDGADLRYYDDVYARSIIELDSGNALLVCDAFKNILSPSPRDRWIDPVKTILIKVDSVGNELWRWLDPSNDSRCAFSFQKTRDGGYISCGLNIGDRDSIGWFYLHQPSIIKWRSDFTKEWEKLYDVERLGDTNKRISGELFDIKELSDGCFIACGYGGQDDFGTTTSGGIILKVDRNGNLLWRKYYSAFPDSSHNRNIQNYLYDIDVFENGDIIAVGETRPTWGVGQRAWILRTDSTGCIVDSNWCGWSSVEVENPYAQSNQAAGIQIYPNPASEYIHIAFTNSALYQEENITLSIIDIQGRSVVNKSETYSENITLDISTLDKGIYFIQIQSASSKVIANAKWVKE